MTLKARRTKVLHRAIEVACQHDAALYECEPGGVLPRYVVVSAVREVLSPYCELHETYIFAADADGRVASWIELPGSFKGDMDHAAALAGAGYAITEDTNQ